MDKVLSFLSNLVDKISIKKIKRKHILQSIVSLILACVVLISTVFCWFYIKDAGIKSGTMKLVADNGIKITSSLENDGIIALKDSNTKLIPASSVDGQNLYFPVDGSFSSSTDSMTFRKANAGDVNENYIKIDFAITADADNTYVYLDDSTSFIKVGDSAENASPIRAAICCADQSDSVVLNPYESKTVQAVKSADLATGLVTKTASQISYLFSDYSFASKHPVVKLNAGETKEFSLIIWLEGTDPDCTNDYIDEDKLTIDMSFTTHADSTDTIKIEDDTTDGWLEQLFIDNENYQLKLVYEDPTDTTAEKQYYTMYRSGEYWSTKIPSNITSDLYFEVLDGDGNVKYTFDTNSKGESTKDRGAYTVYSAEGSKSSCYGHWLDDVETGGIGGDDSDIGDDW